jgi:enoyl-CoA hydratase/carnithine racemase
MPPYQNWLLTTQAHVATLTLNRPDTLNDLSLETLCELRDASAYLSTRQDVWVVILQGQGKHFCTGLDAGVFERGIERPEHINREFLSRQPGCVDAFEALEKPTIAKLRGFCIGGGLILALCCDLRVASQRTVFSLPEIKLGLPVLWGGAQRLSRVVGVATTKEMILLGRRFRAEAAQAHGLVHQVVPPDELDRAVATLADKFQSLPPRSVGIAKRLINRGHDLPLRASQDLEIDALLELKDSPDLREAIESYAEKRRPQFIGE